MDESNLMDLDTIKYLRAKLEDDINTLFDAFITETPSSIENLASVINQQNMPNINNAAHFLKGSGGNIGAGAFSNACNVLEQQSENNALIEPEIQMDNIRQLFDKTVTYMKKNMS